MKYIVEIDSFDVKVKFHSRDIHSRAKSEDGKIRLCAVSCEDFAVFVEKKESKGKDVCLVSIILLFLNKNRFTTTPCVFVSRNCYIIKKSKRYFGACTIV